MGSNRSFNIRVYALIFNLKGEILLADEEYSGKRFTKFPGGGLEWGEGIIEALQRESREELHQELEQIEHFYTTDFFQRSSFHEHDQLISIYYKAFLSQPEELQVGQFPFDFRHGKPSFRWIKVDESLKEELIFPIDLKVLDMILES